MTYSPINTKVFTAAYAGAIAGMAVSGWITDPTSADYSNATIIAGAFAQSFDTIWNDSAALNSLELAAITAIVQTDFNGRGPGPFNSPTYQSPSNWNSAAAACIALVLECDIYFAGQGITPPSPGNSTNLSNVIFVDGGTTVPSASQNGNIESPYATIQEGINACPTGGLVFCTTGTYAENPVIAKTINIQTITMPWNGIADNLSLGNPEGIISGDVTISAGLTSLTGFQLNNLVLTGGTTILNSCTVNVTVNNAEGLTWGNLIANDTTFSNTIDVKSFQTNNCIVSGISITIETNPSTSACYLENTSLPTANTGIAFVGPIGTVNVDTITNANFKSSNVTLTNCNLNLRSESATLAVVTPQTLNASGAGGFTTLLTYAASALTTNMKLEVGIDATATDYTTSTAPVVTELRANRTYYVTGGTLTLLNDSTVFSSANLQFIISGTNLLLQGAFNASGGHALKYVGSLYIKQITIA